MFIYTYTNAFLHHIIIITVCVWLIEVIMTVKGAGNVYWDDTSTITESPLRLPSPRFDPTFHLFYLRFFCSVNLTRYGAIGIVSYESYIVFHVCLIMKTSLYL